MTDEELRFPEELATDVRRSTFFVIENGDIASEEDLNRLIELLFQYPEASFYLFGLKTQGANHLVVSAERHGVLHIERYETQYYLRPGAKHDWVKIDKPNPVWEWEREARDNTPEYIRFTLKLSGRWRRKMELKEAFEESSKPEDSNPLVLKPSFFGMGVDLPKAVKWVKSKWKKKP